MKQEKKNKEEETKTMFLKRNSIGLFLLYKKNNYYWYINKMVLVGHILKTLKKIKIIKSSGDHKRKKKKKTLI